MTAHRSFLLMVCIVLVALCVLNIFQEKWEAFLFNAAGVGYFAFRTYSLTPKDEDL